MVQLQIFKKPQSNFVFGSHVRVIMNEATNETMMEEVSAVGDLGKLSVPSDLAKSVSESCVLCVSKSVLMN